MRKLVVLSISLVFLCGCVSPRHGNSPSMPAFCTVAKPLTMAETDTDATRSEVTEYNAQGHSLCGWEITKRGK